MTTLKKTHLFLSLAFVCHVMCKISNVMSCVVPTLEVHIVITLVSFVVKLLLCLIKLHAMEIYGGMEV